MAAFDSAIQIPAIPNTSKALADAMSKAQYLKLDKPKEQEAKKPRERWRCMASVKRRLTISDASA